jgi:hypothetical protein
MAGTPAQNGNSAAGSNDFSRRAEKLAAKMWPTATSRDWKGSAQTSITRKDGKSRMDQLDCAAEQGFSHPDPETLTHGELSLEQTKLAHLLLRAAMPKPPRSISRPYSPRRKRKQSCSAQEAWKSAKSYGRWAKKRHAWWANRRLSPAFVTWLMGWPPGHALCDCSETEFAHWQQDMRGELSAMPTASGAWIWEPKDETPQPEQLSLI